MSNQTKIDELFIEFNATTAKAMEAYGGVQKHVAANPIVGNVILNLKPLENDLSRVKAGYVELAKNIKDLPEGVKTGFETIQSYMNATQKTFAQAWKSMSDDMKNSDIGRGMIQALTEVEKRGLLTSQNLSSSFKSVKQDWSQVNKDLMAVAVQQNTNPTIQPILERMQRQLEGGKDIQKLVSGPTSNFLGKDFKENIDVVASYLDKLIVKLKFSQEIVSKPIELKVDTSTVKTVTESLKAVEIETVKTGDAVSRVSALYKAAFVAKDELRNEQASANLKLIADLENKKPVSIQPPEIFTTENVRNTVEGINLIDTNLTDLMAHLKNLGLLTNEVTSGMAAAIKKVGIDKIGIDWEAVNKRAEELKNTTAQLETDARVRVDAARAQQRKNLETAPPVIPVQEVRPTFAVGEEERLKKMAAQLDVLKSDYRFIANAAVKSGLETGQSFEEAARKIGATDEEISALISEFVKLDKTIAAIKPIPSIGINELSTATLRTTSEIASSQQASRLLEMLSTAKEIGKIELPEFGIQIITKDTLEAIGSLKNLGMVDREVFEGIAKDINDAVGNLHTLATTYDDVIKEAERLAAIANPTIRPLKPPPPPKLPEPEIVDHPPVETVKVVPSIVKPNEIRDLEGLKTTFGLVTAEADKVTAALKNIGMAESEVTALSMKESAAHADTTKALEDFANNADDLNKFDAAIMSLQNYEMVVNNLSSAIKQFNTAKPIQPPTVKPFIDTSDLQKEITSTISIAQNLFNSQKIKLTPLIDLSKVTKEEITGVQNIASQMAGGVFGDSPDIKKRGAEIYEDINTISRAADRMGITFSEAFSKVAIDPQRLEAVRNAFADITLPGKVKAALTEVGTEFANVAQTINKDFESINTTDVQSRLTAIREILTAITEIFPPTAEYKEFGDTLTKLSTQVSEFQKLAPAPKFDNTAVLREVDTAIVAMEEAFQNAKPTIAPTIDLSKVTAEMTAAAKANEQQFIDSYKAPNRAAAESSAQVIKDIEAIEAKAKELGVNFKEAMDALKLSPERRQAVIESLRLTLPKVEVAGINVAEPLTKLKAEFATVSKEIETNLNATNADALRTKLDKLLADLQGLQKVTPPTEAYKAFAETIQKTIDSVNNLKQATSNFVPPRIPAGGGGLFPPPPPGGGGGGGNNPPPGGGGDDGGDKPPKLSEEELAKLARYQTYLSAIEKDWRKVAEILIQQARQEQIPFNEKVMQFNPQIGKDLIGQFEAIDKAILEAIEVTRLFGETLLKELGPEKAAMVGTALQKVMQDAALMGKTPTTSNFAAEIKKLIGAQTLSGQKFEFTDALKTMEAVRTAAGEMNQTLVQGEQQVNKYAASHGRMSGQVDTTFKQIMQATRAFGGFGLALMGTIPEMQQFMSILFGLVFSFNELQFGLNIIAALFQVTSYAINKANDEAAKRGQLLVTEKRSYEEINAVIKQYTEYEQANGGRFYAGYRTAVNTLLGQSPQQQIDASRKALQDNVTQGMQNYEANIAALNKRLADYDQNYADEYARIQNSVNLTDQQRIRMLNTLEESYKEAYGNIKAEIEKYKAAQTELQRNQGLSPEVQQGMKAYIALLDDQSKQYKQAELDAAKQASSVEELTASLAKLRGIKVELINQQPGIGFLGPSAADIHKAEEGYLQAGKDAQELYIKLSAQREQFKRQQEQEQLIVSAKLNLPQNKIDEFLQRVQTVKSVVGSEEYQIALNIKSPSERIKIENEQILELMRTMGVDIGKIGDQISEAANAKIAIKTPEFAAKYPQAIEQYKAQALQLQQQLGASGASAAEQAAAMDNLALSIVKAAIASDQLTDAQKAMPATNAILNAQMQFRDAYKNLNQQIERAQAEHNRNMQEADSNFMYQRTRQYADFAHQQFRAVQDFNYQQTQAEKDYMRSRQRTIDDFYYNEARTRQDYNYNREKSERDFQIQQARAAEDHQIDMLRLTQQFDLDEREAIAEGNGVQVLRLRRRFDMEAKAREEDYQRNKKRAEEDHARQLADAEELYKRQEALRKESLDRQLAYMDADFAYQQAKQEANFARQQQIAKEEFDRQQTLQKQAFDREQQLNEAHWKQQQANMKQAMEDQLKILAENLGKMGIINAEQAKQLFLDWGTALQDNKIGDALFKSYMWGRNAIQMDAQTFIKWLWEQIMTLYNQINNLPQPGPWAGGTGGTPGGGQKYASGGMTVANRPTSIIMGDADEEIGIFIPKSQLNSLSAGTRTPLTSLRTGNTEIQNPSITENVSRFINEHMFDIKLHIDGDQIRPELEESLLSTLTKAIKDSIPTDFQRSGVKR